MKSAEKAAQPEGRASDILERLAEEGHRLTGPRQALVQLLADRDHLFTAQEAWEQVQATGLQVGRATVFRTLDLLAELGALDRVHEGDGCHRYILCAPAHHHHLMCTECGRVQPFAAPEVEAIIRHVAQEANFEPLTHHLELVGRCGDCTPRSEASKQ
jgi:Fur family transcriptional regulator, ferric uptake regulator